jgi:hypothetical protein
MRFRLLAGDGRVLEEGEGEAGMAGGALVVSPAFGDVLRIAPADVTEIGEPEPYVVHLRLSDGPVLELSGLGHMRTQILGDLADARATDTAETFLVDGVGSPDTFPGEVDGVEAELRLYDDALVTLPVSGDAEKLPYPFILDVSTDDSGYRLQIAVAGRSPVAIGRLARRTTEFLDLVKSRHADAATRTSHFLAALLPGLGPLASRAVSGLLRDGLAGTRDDLDRVDPTVWDALVEAATLPDRLDGVRELAGLGRTWIGFKQLDSVRRPARGGQPWRDSSVTPVRDHDGHASSFGGGLGGVLSAGMVAGGPPAGFGFDGPFQAMGSILAYQMLGTGFGGSGSRLGGGIGGTGFPGGGGFAGGGFGGTHRQLPRADVRRGRLTPETTDYDALTGGEPDRPTVLAFLFCLTGPGHLVYEVLNAADHATYIYRVGDAAHAIALNRALDLIGFRVEGVHQDAGSAASRYRKVAERLPALRVLRQAYAGRVAHGEGWAERLRTRLTG